MNNHDEMVFEKDSLHGLEERKDKTKTQEDTGNHGGYHGPNRKERDQTQRILETRQPTDIDTDKDRNWKVVGQKSSTLMSFICASVINHDITKVMGQ
jgi:hypothetical protein